MLTFSVSLEIFSLTLGMTRRSSFHSLSTQFSRAFLKPFESIMGLFPDHAFGGRKCGFCCWALPPQRLEYLQTFSTIQWVTRTCTVCCICTTIVCQTTHVPNTEKTICNLRATGCGSMGESIHDVSAHVCKSSTHIIFECSQE